MKNIKLDNNSKLLVKRVIERTRDRLGRINVIYQWQEADGDIELGSIKNPKNEDILAFKWVVKDPFRNVRDFFGGSE